MTLSLVAHDTRTGHVGVAVMTAMVGAGKLITYVRPGVGAVATQSHINPYLAHGALDLVQRGVAAPEALERMLATDPARTARQAGVVDLHGGAASATGTEPHDWKGHRTGSHDGGGWACQGNRLAGSEVLDAMVEAFLATPERSLVERFLDVLAAGAAAGGDTKGHLSANIVVMDREVYPLWDLRVDHHEDPLAEIHELYEVTRTKLAPQIAEMPRRDDFVGGLPLEQIVRSG